MLLVQHIRDHYDQVLAGLKKRNLTNAAPALQQVLALDDLRKSSQTQRDQLQAEANTISKEIGTLMKEGKTAEATAVRDRSALLKNQIKELEEQHEQAEEELKALLYTLPNVPFTAVPAGKSAEGFPAYKGKGARLQRALINFFLDQALAAGYVEVQPPILVNEDSGYGTGQLPDKEGQMYFANEDKLYLIPTAEVPITNMYRDVLVNVSDLPIKNVGYTPCFRREAGSWGAHVRGLNRLHQFDKVEIVQITHPDNSYTTLEEMSAYVQGLLRQLELPYRVLRLCGGDMGFTSAMTYDMEVYSAAQERWLEVSSVSNFETYQANRLKLRFKGEDKKSQLAHTLNGSALALPRIVASILENNQEPDGIRMPKVLHPYLGFDRI